MSNRGWWWTLPVLLLCSASLLHADEVTLDNGQKLLGRISKFEDPDLFLSVHFADSNIPIRWKNIVSLETSAPIRIELRNGKAYFANIRMNEEGIVLIVEPGAEAPFETTRDAIYAMEERKGVLDGEVGLSGTGSTGSLDTQSFRLYWDLFFQWEETDFQIKGDATFDTADGATTGRTAYGQVRYDWRFGDPAFLFGSTEANHDLFGDIKVRSITTVGLGTYLFNSQTFLIRADVGLTYTVSRLYAGEDSETPGYRPSLRFQWKLPLDLRVKDYLTFYGNFKDESDWQARNELSVSREVFKGFHLNGGLTSTWDHGAAPGVHRRDDTYYFGIGYEF
jgi:putative salt-induced outer membrane protein YdiY